MMQNNIFSRAKYDKECDKYGQLLAVGIAISHSAYFQGAAIFS